MTDLASLLEARAAALLQGVSKLPPIEQDLRRLRKQPEPRPVAFAWPPVWTVVPAPCVVPAPPRAVPQCVRLPSPTVDSRVPLPSPVSLAAAPRSRRSSDYSAVSARTRELTLYALVETLLQANQPTAETASRAAAETASRRTAPGPLAAHAPRQETPVAVTPCETSPPVFTALDDPPFQQDALLVPSSGAASPRKCLSPRSGAASPRDAKLQALGASRCSTTVGCSRASFWEDDDDDELFLDEQSTFVPKPQYRKQVDTL
eukprot:Gregarina_sp_Pseudo_9__347@NODE_1224_length_1768_cov_11_201851_g1150_i0_p1_GENE_NODE_1224_length_1768_cov_11_201851_g1150_i0NODE_1224_length_1768_cov_11_201851_g1150_i0_p1_ORF_typecomplete_len261_score88_59_NODE_1224_length_1768_cov_11_201851_g1150_i05381320